VQQKKVFSNELKASQPCWLGVLVKVAMMEQVFTNMTCTQHMDIVRHALVG